MLNSFDDELVIAGDVEDGATSSWICQLNQGLVTQGILAKTQRNKEKFKFDLNVCFTFKYDNANNKFVILPYI